jgi:hypothetical protein
MHVWHGWRLNDNASKSQQKSLPCREGFGKTQAAMRAPLEHVMHVVKHFVCLADSSATVSCHALAGLGVAKRPGQTRYAYEAACDKASSEFMHKITPKIILLFKRFAPEGAHPKLSSPNSFWDMPLF